MTRSDPLREAISQILNDHAWAIEEGHTDEAVDAILAALPTPPAPLDVERLAKAMWDGLSDRGVLCIDAHSPKELNDVAASVAREYAALEGAPHDPE